MAASKVFEGTFFLVEDPENKQTGILTVDEDNQSTLKIFGSFNRPSPAIDIKSYNIWGQFFDGQAISLLDCSRKQKTTTFGVAETETWRVGYVLLGCTVKDRDLPYFNSISIEIEGFREWVNIDGGEYSFKNDGTAYSYKYEDPASISFEVNDNVKGYIYFKNEFWVGLDYKNQSEQKTRLHFESNSKMSLLFFLLMARNFRNLISLFIGQKVRIKKMMLTSTEEHVKLISPTRPGEPILKDIELLFTDKEQYGNLSDRLNYFVKYEDIAPDFGEIIKQWIALIESPLAPITEILITAITDHSLFEENDFLKAWQGVEAFHRIVIQNTEELKNKFNNWYGKIRDMVTDDILLKKLDGKMTYGYEIPAPNRLMELLKNNSSVLNLNTSSAQMDYWVKEMSNTRNYLTHFEPTMSEKKAPLQHIVYYRSLLKAILIILILRRLGVREELLGNVAKNSVFYYHPLKKIGLS